MKARNLWWMIGIAAPALAQETPPPAEAPAAEAAGPAEALEPPVLQEFREATLPPDLDVVPGTYTVTLTLTIDENGQVGEAEVAQADDERLAGPALEAARGFRFQPARYQGQPVPVQVTYRYAFDIQPKERQVVFRFRLLEKGYRDARPLDGVTALVEETGRPFTSENGILEVSDLPPGTYTLYLPPDPFAEVRQPFTVKDGEVGEQTLRLDRRFDSTNQTVIRAPREVRFVARQTLQAEELRRLPGSGGDPLKMVENLPGIARSAFGTGQLVVFGSPPFDTQVLIDGLPFVMLYHFGGVYSTIQPEFIEKIDFVPAGFDASQGRASGGIVDVKVKEAPLDRLRGSVDMNLIHAGLYVGLPYSENGDFQFAFRRSYLDAILSAVSFGQDAALQTAPRYYDYQARVQHRWGRHRFSLFLFGTDDALVVVNKKANTQEPAFVGTASLSMAGHNLQARWSWEGTGGMSNVLSAQVALNRMDFNLFNSLDYHISSLPIRLREEFTFNPHARVRLHLGLDGWYQPSWYEALTTAPDRQGAVGIPIGAREKVRLDGTQALGSVAPYLSVEWRPFDAWTIVPSVRLDGYFGDWKAWSVDPRLSTRVEVLKDRLFLRAAGGLYQQPPPVFAYVRDLGNPGLKPEAAAHALLGIEYLPTDRLSVQADGFFKWLFRRAEASDDRTVRYTNDGKGRAYGFDVLVRLNPGGRLFGWVAYTFVRSEIWDPRARAWRLSDYDQTHLLNILASYELPRHWTIGGRFRLTSGFPYTPIEGSRYDSDLDRYVAVPAARINSARLPLFHQLDLRVDKEWVYDTWRLGLYLELQNAYNAKNAEAILYNYDYSQRANLNGLTILPVLGLKGSF